VASAATVDEEWVGRSPLLAGTAREQVGFANIEADWRHVLVGRFVIRLFDLLDQSPVVVIPPVEYPPDGSVSYSVFGPSSAIQSALEEIPEPITVSVTDIGSLAAVPSAVETTLSDRQREAIQAAVELGYYDIPRRATQEDIASAIGCPPPTAAEHLQKAESKLLRSVVTP